MDEVVFPSGVSGGGVDDFGVFRGVADFGGFDEFIKPRRKSE